MRLGLLRRVARSTDRFSATAALGLKSPVFRPQRFLRFHVRGIYRYAAHRANLNALWFTKVPYTLRAFAGLNDIVVAPHRYGLVRALRLANITVDAFIGDHECHGDTPEKM